MHAMRPHLLALSALLAVSACDGGERNPPTEPAAPIDTPEASAPPPPSDRPPGAGTILPGAGPRSFVGRWAADVSWCPNDQGAQRPIEITTTRFEGYENSCAIGQITETVDGYELALTCTAEGSVSNERVRTVVSGQTLRLTWLNRDGASVNLAKCTTLADGASS